MVESPLSIYIHVPFCTRKCDYCHFYVIPNEKRFVTQYLSSLKIDIDNYRQELESHKILSIYFGGGTPSLLEADSVATILSYFMPYIKEPIEITLEANPESLSFEKIKELKKIGVNRISIGIQSFDDRELLLLSRQHNGARAKEAVLMTKEGGIDNISIDLIYDLPLQTEAIFHSTLVTATTLPITHLSLYNLTIEPHTSFYKNRERLVKEMPNERVSLTLLEKAEEHLEMDGLKRYEISAFAREGRESIHNSGYWTGRPYLGFGPSAHSFYNGIRTRKNSHFQRWNKALHHGERANDFFEELPPQAAAMERLVIGLRLFTGVLLESRMKTEELFSLIEEGLVTLVEDRALLTKRGRLFYDYVAERLVVVTYS